MFNYTYMNTVPFEKIINEIKNDKNFSMRYLQELYNYNMDLNLPIKSNSPLTSIKCFYPLPTRLLLTEDYTDQHKIIKLKNEYQFHGIPGNRLIFADKKLPFITKKIKYPIPFSFPINNGNQIEIITSNVYYYEVKLLETQNIQHEWIGECVSIGFGNVKNDFNTHVGWSNNSIGFHSDDGTIRFNETYHTTKVYSNIWKSGDVAGAGVIFINKNTIKPFFTFNGKLIYMSEQTIELLLPYFPIIGYDHSKSIEINFSSKPFVFDIKNIIYKNSNIVISSENSFIIDYDIGNILNEQPNFNSDKKFINFLQLHENNINPFGELSGLSGLSGFSELSGFNGLNGLNIPSINGIYILPNNITSINPSLLINSLSSLNINSTPINSLALYGSVQIDESNTLPIINSVNSLVQIDESNQLPSNPINES